MDFDLVAFADRYGWFVLDLVLISIIVPILWVRTWIMKGTLEKHLDACTKGVEEAKEQRKEIYLRLTELDKQYTKTATILEYMQEQQKNG